jgi:ABC-type antimicrobial peptide transport system permease subunit
MDSGLVVNVNRLEENLEIWRSLSRLAAVLSGSMGALALLLASIGVYGVVAYAVSRRLREVGIRMALGASGRDVMSMLLRQAMTPVLVGAVIGVLACAAVSHILSSALFGVSPLDPIVFVVAPACLIAVAVLASVIPARLVMRVDPVNTLRYE